MTIDSTDQKEIRLFLMDDHQAVVASLIELVAQDSRLNVVGYACDTKDLLQSIRELQPDVLVLDICMPGLNGLEACRLVKANVPKMRVVMLTMHSSKHVISEALKRGASGYLVKNEVDELCQAVHQVHRGEIYLSQGIPRNFLQYSVNSL